jgi:hypothetical protein
MLDMTKYGQVILHISEDKKIQMPGFCKYSDVALVLGL